MKNRIDASTRKKINKNITDLTKKYFSNIPLAQINYILKAYDCWLIQEDGTPWEGFLLGSSSHTTIDLGNENGRIENSVLYISWHKLTSGNYEVVAYIS